MNLVQMMLTHRLRHELPYAIVQSAVNYQIRAVGGAGPLILNRRPFSKSCRRIKVDVILVVHIGLRTHLSLLVQVADEVVKHQINAADKNANDGRGN
jgi:hypothetical protein